MLVAGVLAGCASGVAAAGISAAQSGTVLGQPLDFPVQVRLDAGETLEAECVSAEVYVSERRVPAAMVRALVDQQNNGSARVRVQTQQVVDEPVVSVTLRVGCVAPITRRFVVFADPPANVAAAAPAAVPAQAPLQPTANMPLPLVAQPIATPAESGRAAATAVQPVAAPPPTLQRRPRALETAAQRAAASSPGPRPARPAAGVVATRRTPAREALPRPVPATVLAAPAAAPTPRLTLEPALPTVATTSELTRAEADAVGAALVAVAQAASAAQVAAVAASASASRVASLERTVAQLRTEAQANLTLATQLRERLDQAQGGGPWLWPLLVLALGLAGLAAWLAWRLGRLQAVRQMAWSQHQAAAPSASPRAETLAERQSRAATGPAPYLGTDVPTFPPRSGLGSLQTVPGASVAAPGLASQALAASRKQSAAWPEPQQALSPSRLRGAADLPDISPMDTPMARTEPMPQPLRGGDGNVRDVSIEELIDLEQQAEFFVVLGQDDAAVDLLVDHLRSTGGGSPLPYLKLLEIYSRTGDHGAYERNRARFNHRFNAYAPEWGSDLAHGRSLEDYPGILPRLEQVWPRPLDAMAELEALLFRKSRGELFELPAYREVLFLYALARDLLDREAADTGSVDLLLPLTDGSAFGTTAPIPFLHEDLREHTFDFDDMPTGPVDFDLTIPAQQTSMFDPMEEPPRPPRRR